MDYIVLPTDLFAMMQDKELNATEQLVYLALIINRPVNMTGVYSLKKRELLNHMLASIPDKDKIIAALERLCEVGMITYDDDILFIPLIPEASKYSRHNYRFKMNKQVEKLRLGNESNRALHAYDAWFFNNVERDGDENESEAQLAEEAYLENGEGLPQNEGTPMQKTGTPTQNPGRPIPKTDRPHHFPTQTTTDKTRQGIAGPIQKPIGPIPKRVYPYPKNEGPLSLSSSSSISSIRHNAFLKRGAGENNQLENPASPYDVFDRVAAGGSAGRVTGANASEVPDECEQYTDAAGAGL